MASSLQSFEPHSNRASAVRGGSSSDRHGMASDGYGMASDRHGSAFERHEMARWEMRIGFGQVVVLWAVLAGMMVMVFMFGFHAGREQGLSRALDAAESEAVRLPIAQPVPSADGIADPTQLAMGTGVSPTAQRDGGAEIPAAGSEQEFDFSKSASASVAKEEKKEVATGLSSKPALEMFKEEKSGPNLAALEVKKPKVEKPKVGKVKELEALIEKKKPLKSVEPAKAKKPAKLTDLTLSQISPPLKKAEKPKAASAEISAPDAGVTPVVKAPPKVKVQSAGTKLASGWYIQAAATRTKEDAAALVAKFSGSSLPGVIEQAKVRKKEYFRVLVGPYGDKAKAIAGKEQVKKSGITGGEPFLKHVK